MAQGTSAISFYIHDSFVKGYYTLYIALEQWIANTIFRGDMSRIFLASNEYAFRRRFELVDPSVQYDTIKASSLQFPFANYWPNNEGWKPDERPAANTAALLLHGLSLRTRMVRAMSVMTSIPITFYFDREDDARLAYETLLWMSFQEQLLYTQVAWKGEKLPLPLNVKIQNLAFNPDFKEQDWLSQNRIFTIAAVFDLRSYSLYPPKQPPASSQIPIDDDEQFAITEEAILLLKKNNKLIGDISVDTLFNQNPHILVNQFAVANATPTTVRLVWDVTLEGSLELEAIKLQISGKDSVTLGPTVRDYTFRKLQENSTYIATLTLMAKDGPSKVVYVQFTTPLSSESARTKKASPNSLVGITF